MHGRYYDGRVLTAEFSPVIDISRHWCEGRCKQFDKNGLCRRGHQCNYLHVKPLSERLRKDLRLFWNQDSKRRKLSDSPNKSTISSEKMSSTETSAATVNGDVDNFLDSLQHQ